MPTIIVPKNTSATAKPERLAVSAKEAAQMLGVTDRTVRNWTKSGELHARRIGGRVLYPVASLNAFLNEHDDNPEQ